MEWATISVTFPITFTGRLGPGQAPNEDNRPFPISIPLTPFAFAVSLVLVLVLVLPPSLLRSERAWPKRLSQSDRRPQPKKTDDPFSLLPHSSACFFFLFLVSFSFLQSTGSQSRVLGLSGSRTLGLGFGFSCEFEFEVQVQSLGPSVVRSILITLIKVLPSLVFFTPFLTNYAGISCFRFCSSRRRRRVRWSLCSLEPLLIVVL